MRLADHLCYEQRAATVRRRSYVFQFENTLVLDFIEINQYRCIFDRPFCVGQRNRSILGDRVFRGTLARFICFQTVAGTVRGAGESVKWNRDGNKATRTVHVSKVHTFRWRLCHVRFYVSVSVRSITIRLLAVAVRKSRRARHRTHARPTPVPAVSVTGPYTHARGTR